MNVLTEGKEGSRHLLMGNEAIVRGALEAGVSVAAGYPGTPASEIIERLAESAASENLYVEWSVNEKVALEVAAAASFAGLAAMAVMKQPGLNVAADFLLHLSGSGTRGPMVLVSADDPGALSSVNEGESRHYAKMMEIPLLEPGNFQEAKDMTRWAFELSREIRNVVMVRTVTRLSHASGSVIFGDIPEKKAQAGYTHDGFILDPMEGVIMSPPVEYKHGLQQDKLKQAAGLFETSPFNTWNGPENPENPELVIITSSICSLYVQEAVDMLGAGARVGVLKLGTTWPLPEKLIESHLKRSDKILVVEEVLPFLEDEIRVLYSSLVAELGIKTIYGKKDRSIPSVGEMNVDKVAAALSGILQIERDGVPLEYGRRATEISFTGSPGREATFCPGCPHRASFWSINKALSLENNNGFLCGDIGCYSMAVLPAGFSTIKTLHAMGSGTGIASAFGKLVQFGLNQSVLSVCGDSTFFHSVMPPLVNAIHHQSDLTLVVLDNSGTAMTGFQSHPGLNRDAMGNVAPKARIADIAKAMGARVEVCDPFDVDGTQTTLLALMEEKGVKVLVLNQSCALSPDKKSGKNYSMRVDEAACVGDSCGCSRMCTRVFACPGLVWSEEDNRSKIDEVTCAGCGVCASICPRGAILKEEAR